MRVSYEQIYESYEEIKQLCCDRSQGSGSVLLLPSHEVDAAATAKVLQLLFRGDGINHTICPVNSITALLETYKNRSSNVRVLILINCGAQLHLSRLLGLEFGDNSLKVLVLDHRRPWHLANIHSVENVVCFDDQRSIDCDAVPEAGLDDLDLFADINDNDEDDNSENNNDDNENNDEDDEDDNSENSENISSGDEDNGEDEAELDENINNNDNEIVHNEIDIENTIINNDVNNNDEDNTENDNNEIVADDNNDSDNEEEEDEEEPVIRGRRGRVNARRSDPEQQLAEKVRQYYGRGSSHAAPTCVNLMWLLQGVYKDGRRVPLDIMWQIILGNF